VTLITKKEERVVFADLPLFIKANSLLVKHMISVVLAIVYFSPLQLTWKVLFSEYILSYADERSTLNNDCWLEVTTTSANNVKFKIVIIVHVAFVFIYIRKAK